jgi:hypothetical protein
MMMTCFPSRMTVLVRSALISNTRRPRTDGLPLFTRSGHSQSEILWKAAALVVLKELTSSKSDINPAFPRNKMILKLGRNRQWKEMLLIHEKEKEGFNNLNYATMMSQLGRIRFVDRRDPLFKEFLDDLGNQVEVRGLRWLEAKGVANIMHAIAKMQLRNHITSRILFSQVENHAEWLVKEGNPQDIADTVLACAKLGVEWPKLFLQVENHAERLVKECTPHAIATTVWACAKLGVESPKLFLQVENHAERLVKEGKPQDIANTVWACAKLGVESPKLFLQVENHAERLVKEGNPQAIANTVWACATLGVESPNLSLQVKRRSCQKRKR